MLKVDNAAVRKKQIERLEKLRAERDQAAVHRSLDALTACAGGAATATCSSSPSTRRGRVPPSARSRTRSRRCGVATTAEIRTHLRRVQWTRWARRPSAVVETRARTKAFAEARGSPTAHPRSRRWARTATTAGRRSSRRRSPTSASMSTWGRCSRRQRRRRAPPSRTTCTSSAPARSRPGTSRWSRRCALRSRSSAAPTSRSSWGA